MAYPRVDTLVNPYMSIQKPTRRGRPMCLPECWHKIKNNHFKNHANINSLIQKNGLTYPRVDTSVDPYMSHRLNDFNTKTTRRGRPMCLPECWNKIKSIHFKNHANINSLNTKKRFGISTG